MDTDSIIRLVVAGTGSLAVLVPVIGLTARFTLRPIVEALARLRESSDADRALKMVERRLVLVEQELQATESMRTDVRRLVEEDDFRRELAMPSPSVPR